LRCEAPVRRFPLRARFHGCGGLLQRRDCRRHHLVFDNDGDDGDHRHDDHDDDHDRAYAKHEQATTTATTAKSAFLADYNRLRAKYLHLPPLDVSY